MGRQAFIGIDVGSASVRAGIFDAEGHRLAFSARPIQQYHPRALHVEQSAADIWAQTAAAVREAVVTAGTAPSDIAAIGVDATCSVSMAEDGESNHDIIMRMDHRAAEQTVQINATGDEALAYGTRHIIESMNAAGHRIERIVMCGGGSKNPYWLRENADATGCEIHLVNEEDAVMLGAVTTRRGGQQRVRLHAGGRGEDGQAGRQSRRARRNESFPQRQIRDLPAIVRRHGALPLRDGRMAVICPCNFSIRFISK